MASEKTIVCGLDGAGMDLLGPWLDNGELPNIARVHNSGINGDLRSVLPPVTSPNWKAYLTGLNPAKFGIFWWENIDVETGRVYYPSERKQRQPEFWESIAETTPVGILGVPTTHPPKTIQDGYVVAGAPDGENNGYTSPPTLEARLESEFDYRVTKQNRIKDDPDAATREILDLIDLRFRTAKELLSEYEIRFQQVTTFYLNSLHHFLWDDEATLRAWQTIDDHVGDFLDAGYNVVLMSDHGSNRIETVFHVNSWLEAEGYLTYDMSISEKLHRVGVNTDRLKRVATALGVKDRAQELAPELLIAQIPDEQGGLKREQKTSHVDWAETAAIASGQGPVYLTADPDSDAYERLRTEIVERLKSLTDPDDRPVVDAVYRSEEVYEGSYLDDAPDLIIDQADAVHIPGDIGREAVFSDPAEGNWRAENNRTGLFAATGPDFGSGTVENISILDLAPTLLHLFDQPIPSEMDGTVQTNVFAPESDARERQVTTIDTNQRRRTEIERIRAAARRRSI